MNNDEQVIKIRDHIYDFLHFDKLTCHILSEYYADSDMVLEFMLCSNNKEISFEIIGNNLEIYWNKNECDKYKQINELTKIRHTCDKSGKCIVRIKGKLLKFLCCSKNIVKVINWNYYLTDLSLAFYGCSNLITVPIYIPEYVQDTSQMFYSCTELSSNFSKWDVSNVRNMHYMFYRCHNFNSDISKWNVSNVENMRGMFYSCHNFNSDISKWDVSNVQNMSYMFYNCGFFNCDISKWNVFNFQYINYIFVCCCNISEKYIPKFNKN